LIVALGLSVLPVTPAAAADVISFRASAQSAATQTTHRVTIPTAVRETDALLLFVTGNRANLLAYDGTAADPIGTFASAAETVTRTTHTTPGASVSTAGSWVVSY
jgi:hypothetical protein